MATDPPHAPAPGWRRPICTMCKEEPAVCVGPYAGTGPFMWMRCAGCCKVTHLTGTCVPIGDEAMERAPGPTFNHTRSDGPFDPCPECAPLMSPSAREPLYRDVIECLLTEMQEMMVKDGHDCETNNRFPCCRARRVLNATAPPSASPKSPRPFIPTNGWTIANWCEACRVKPGDTELCALCLERRGLRIGQALHGPRVTGPGMRVRLRWTVSPAEETVVVGRDDLNYGTAMERAGSNVSDGSHMWRDGGVVFLGWTDPSLLKAAAVNRVGTGDGAPTSAAVAPTPPSGEETRDSLSAGVGVGLQSADHGRTRIHSGLCSLCRNPDDLCPDERCRSCCSFSHGIHPGDPPAPDRFITTKTPPQRRPPGPVELYREVERLEGELRKAVEAWTDAMIELPAGGQVGRAR